MKNAIHKMLILMTLGFFATHADAQVTRKQRNRIDRREDVRDRNEDVRDRREDVRDRREDVRDAQHQGGPLDRIEDRRDRREDVRDRREDVRDKKEDRRDRRRRGTFSTYPHPTVIIQTPGSARFRYANPRGTVYHPRHFRHRRHFHGGPHARRCH
ncbi:MAG: hypothetical protein EBR94_09665 [Bacteroidetes bacterium]|nr:hypothetical protein [Bacteroidota bacterium]